MNIFLFGFKKCGKTYFGLKVAQKLHRDFINSGHLIEQLYTAEYHQTLSYRDIAKKHGFILENQESYNILQNLHD